MFRRGSTHSARSLLIHFKTCSHLSKGENRRQNVDRLEERKYRPTCTSARSAVARKFKNRKPFVAMASISSLNCSGIFEDTLSPSLSKTEYSRLMTPGGGKTINHHLGLGQTSNFSCAEPNANELKQRTFSMDKM